MLRQRVMTAVIAVILLLIVLYWLPASMARAVIALAFVAAAWEWSSFLKLQSTGARFAFVALVGALEAALWWVLPDAGIYRLVLYTAVGWWFIALVWLYFFPTAIPSVVGWVGGILVLLPAYVALDWLYLESPTLLLALLVIVWLADIGAYFAGRAFGRVKLAPAISPGKTWEGVLGGLVAVLVVVAIFGVSVGRPLAVLLPFVGAVALLSVVGDLTVSMFKRHAGIKDSGKLFPGHGGILDRIDSVCAAAPLFAAGLSVLAVR